jgi:hypothetical protein
MSLCGSNSCIFGAPLGAGVNGPCSCFDTLPREDSMHVRRAILGLRNDLKSITVERDKYHRQAQDLEHAESAIRVEVTHEVTNWIHNNTYNDIGEASWGLLDEAIARGVARGMGKQP